MPAMENLTDMAMFVRVVESGSFTAAADKLGAVIERMTGEER
jgi:hypothetical protein